MRNLDNQVVESGWTGTSGNSKRKGSPRRGQLSSYLQGPQHWAKHGDPQDHWWVLRGFAVMAHKAETCTGHEHLGGALAHAPLW